MATIPFLGTGDPIEAFNIDNVLINKEMFPGEVRLRSPFPYPTLEMWRRTALQHAAADVTTGSSDIATRGRAAMLFAHEADMGSIFGYLVNTDPALLNGYYVDKLKAQDVAKTFETALTQKRLALQELRQQGVPAQVTDLVEQRLVSEGFNQRVAGLCAAVYLTSILLSEANL